MKGFSISKRENVKESISRILLGQIDYILKQCESEQQDVHISIHEIRKSIKRIRAVLRLIREEIGYSSYYRENVFYREINRSISDLRTHNVLLHTLESLQSDLSGKIPAEILKPVTDMVREQRQLKLSEVLSDDKLLRGLSVLFTGAKARIPNLPIERNSFKALSGGVFRMYRQGKDYLIQARKNPDMHHLHDMRKRMKYLWYQVEILRPIYPGMLKAYSRSLENITEKLGVYHDLAVASEFLRENDGGLREEIHETLLDACEFRKSALLPGLLKESEILFSEEPELLVQRLGEYWRIYYREN
jgi:CHAD domain-containing protein